MQLAKRLDAAGIYKNAERYYKREEVYRMLEEKVPGLRELLKKYSKLSGV